MRLSSVDPCCRAALARHPVSGCSRSMQTDSMRLAAEQSVACAVERAKRRLVRHDRRARGQTFRPAVTIDQDVRRITTSARTECRALQTPCAGRDDSTSAAGCIDRLDGSIAPSESAYSSDAACHAISMRRHRARRPSPRDRAEGRVDEGGVLVAGVAEVDEPLAVDRPRHLLQHLNPPPIVLNQVVEGAEDR